jgi:hypothetical protein
VIVLVLVRVLVLVLVPVLAFVLALFCLVLPFSLHRTSPTQHSILRDLCSDLTSLPTLFRDAARAIEELTDTELHGRKMFVREDREVGGGKNENPGRSRNDSRRESGRGDSSEVSLYVGNIPWDLSWQDLKDAFGEYDCVFSDVGEIRNGRARGFGIVKVPNMGSAKRAIKEMNEVRNEYTFIVVDLSCLVVSCHVIIIVLSLSCHCHCYCRCLVVVIVIVIVIVIA